jgi:hypothetical protein
LQKLHPQLQKLLEKSFFRYFQYNPHRKCPFWDMSKEVCHSGACGVKPCPKDKIPEAVLSSAEKQVEELSFYIFFSFFKIYFLHILCFLHI